MSAGCIVCVMTSVVKIVNYYKSSFSNDLTPVERRLASGNCGHCAKAGRRWVVRKLGSARAILKASSIPWSLSEMFALCSHGWNKPI